MYLFDENKLKVIYKEENLNIEDRRYTLTHSDETGELFLTINSKYDKTIVNSLRDEVIGRWRLYDGEYILELAALVGINDSLEKTIIRDKIFRKEMHLAIKSIIYGDLEFLKKHNINEDTQINIYFKSKIPEYNTIDSFGTIGEYIDSDSENLLRGENNLNKENRKWSIKDRWNKGNNNIKNKMLKEVTLTLLSPYIDREIVNLFGRIAPYCLSKSRIVSIEDVKGLGNCQSQYRVVVRVRVGRPIPKYDNATIVFLINNNRVRIVNSNKNK